MGFFFRKSLGSNLFRLNFSTSGVSVSTGIKGARINFSSRGTYVNFGSNGIYYRKKISGFTNSSGKKQYEYLPETFDKKITTTIEKVDRVTDFESRDFIAELTEKSKKISYYKWFGILPHIILSVILFYIFFSERTLNVEQKTETLNFVKSNTEGLINIRKNADKNSEILGSADYISNYKLLDNSNEDWFKIEFNGQEAFLSKKFSEIITEQKITQEAGTITEPSLFHKKANLFWILFLAINTFFFVLEYFLRKLDYKRLSMFVIYDVNEDVKPIYENFLNSFSKIKNSSKVWQYILSQKTNDYKYSSGARKLVERTQITNIFTDKKPTKYFETNVQVPNIVLLNSQLYFFPERIIIKKHNEFGAIMYKNIESFSEVTTFIEANEVPKDAEVFGYTWKYLNKNGTPDKRFTNNHQIPICKYSEYTLKSDSGFFEKISTSKVGCFDEFLKYLKAIGTLQENFSENNKIN